MTTINATIQAPMARCSRCDHDLVAKGRRGNVYCSNKQCSYYQKKPHPTGPDPNAGFDGR